MGQQKYLRLMQQEEELKKEQQNLQVMEAELRKNKDGIEAWKQQEADIKAEIKQFKKKKRKRRRNICAILILGIIVSYITYGLFYSTIYERKVDEHRIENEKRLDEYQAELEK